MKNLSNNELILSLENEFSLERKTTHTILLYLREIQIRKLYADRGYPNLFSMLVHFFQQSESAANQRLHALKLMNDVPEIENSLKAVKVNLSTLAMTQRQIQREEKAIGKKITLSVKAKIVERITNKTMAQSEKELMTLLPESLKLPQTHQRRISQDITRLSVNLPDRVKEKLEKLKNHWASVNPNIDYVEIIKRAADIALQKVDPVKQVDPLKNAKQTTVKHCASESEKRKTYYPVATDRALWEKANSQCEYVDTETGQRCLSCFGLERDHILPFALGGSNDISNLRLLCRSHNQLMARRHFGVEKIDYEIHRSRRSSE